MSSWRYNARASGTFESYCRNGRLIIEGDVLAQGNSSLEIRVAAEMGKELGKAGVLSHGIVRAIEFAAQNGLSPPEIKLLGIE